MRRWLLLGTLVVAVAGCTTNPVTGKQQLDLLGEAQEIEIGRSLYPQSLQQFLGPISDERAQALVRQVGESVAAVGHRPALPYEFTAVNDPMVNAFALPGGKICITRGLVARLDSVDGLAAVLGHEVGHVTARHAVSAYNRQILAGVVMLGAGVYVASSDDDNRGLVALGALLGTQLALAHYSREQERQSDDLGLKYAVDAGYSPRGMVETQSVLLALRKSRPGLLERMFASHPMSAERLAKAEREVAALPLEVRERPLEKVRYKRAMEEVVRTRPAWDLAGEGRQLLGEKRSRQAEERFAEAARSAPGEGVLRTLHAIGLEAVKRHGDAIQAARQGATMAPGVLVSQMVAGELLVDSDPREALRRLDAAEELLPGLADVSYLQGKALEKLGERDKAVAAYREAVRRDPQGQGAGAAAAKRLQAMGAASQGG